MAKDGYMVRLHVWVPEAPNEETARGAVKRMVERSRECTFNGDVDIDDVVEWDNEG